MRPRLRSWDYAITAYLQDWPSLRLLPYLKAISLLGTPAFTSSLVLIAAFVCWQADERRLAVIFLLCIVSFVGVSLLKLITKRKRPATPYAMKMWPRTYSFPSGHSFDAVVTYGTFTLAAVQLGSMPLALAVGISAALVSALVGYTRIYLGAHYALDVLGGWLFGSLVVAAFALSLG